MSVPIDVGTDLQVLWDDHVVDTAKTTAMRVMHHPECAGLAISHDRAWEGDACGYHCIFKDGDRYRMYYNACALRWAKPRHPVAFANTPCETRICYAESTDGVNWTRPNLGICTFNGSKENNIIIDRTMHGALDNFYVFKDTKPACPREELYKGVTSYEKRLKPGEKAPAGMAYLEHATWDDGVKREKQPFARALCFFVSADGVHFSYGRPITSDGAFDTQNVCFWDSQRQCYFCYYRGYHGVKAERNGDLSIRDIRVITSKDGIVWTRGTLLDFGEGAEDISLYTNGVQPYPRNPKLFTGLPTRYVERREWVPNYDRLPRPEARKNRFRISRREGLVLTDVAFMFSRDGKRFVRYDEAFMRPGPQGARNWVYGDGYLSPVLLTARGFEESDDVLVIYAMTGHEMGEGESVYRYTLRQDGFVSRQAPYAGAKVVTKPLVFAGKELLINFSTSARGRMFVTAHDDFGRSLGSVELFGDQVDRVVDFEKDELASFAGKPVTLEFEMSDADLYSFRFK